MIKYSDGDVYTMKKFDDNPLEDPKERLEPEEYSDTLVFDISAGKKINIEIEITTLTGCNSPVHITMSRY